MRTFRCVPIAIALPILAAFATLLQVGMAIFCYTIKEPDVCVYFAFCAVCALILGLVLLPTAMRRVEFRKDRVICKGLVPTDTFEINYETCNIGMDYHVQNGGKIWWIYLCYGAPPQYKMNNPANRMNAVKIKPGFVKIMYSKEVFHELIYVLPKKHRTSLLTAWRCAGFE